MSIGPGKYDEACTMVRSIAGARGAIVIVIDGRYGSGFSVQGDLTIQARLPDMLEHMAAQIRADVRHMNEPPLRETPP